MELSLKEDWASVYNGKCHIGLKYVITICDKSHSLLSFIQNYSPFRGFICDPSVVSHSVLSLGNFLSLYVLPYFCREAQKLGE